MVIFLAHTLFNGSSLFRNLKQLVKASKKALIIFVRYSGLIKTYLVSIFSSLTLWPFSLCLPNSLPFLSVTDFHCLWNAPLITFLSSKFWLSSKFSSNFPSSKRLFASFSLLCPGQITHFLLCIPSLLYLYHKYGIYMVLH